jgi:hypothetical protein
LRGKILIAILGIVTMADLSFAVQSASAATSCQVRDALKANPGLSTKSSKGTVKSNPTKGPNDVKCNGTVEGAKVTGPGKISTDADYGDESANGSTCTTPEGRGDGVQTITIPTDKGMKTIKNTFTFTYRSNPKGVWDIEVKGDKFSGKGTAHPTSGDCVSKPVTELEVDSTYNGG